MNEKKNDIKEAEVNNKGEADKNNIKEDAAEKTSAFERLRQSVSEEDEMPASSMTLRTILGGDILYAEVFKAIADNNNNSIFRHRIYCIQIPMPARHDNYRQTRG